MFPKIMWEQEHRDPKEILCLVQFMKLNETRADTFISSGLLKFNTDLMDQMKDSGLEYNEPCIIFKRDISCHTNRS